MDNINELEKELASAMFQHGCYKLIRGNVEGAIKEFKGCLKYSPEDKVYLKALKDAEKLNDEQQNSLLAAACAAMGA